jgi:N-acetylglucosaminyldiphosphoundecaprenol N-acetyl-beta-D-mannosaminyltransferase
MAIVLGIKLYNLNISAACDHVLAVIKNNAVKANRLISATGAHGLVIAQKVLPFKKILNEFYINLPDGVPGVWIGRLKGSANMKPCPGPDFFAYMIKKTADADIRHFFCGGKPGVADELKEACIKKYNNNNIVGTYSPPFRDMSDKEMQELGRHIQSLNADIVWIGLSTPRQEQFAYRLRNYTSTQFIVTVGAAFDFHTGRVRYAPAWMQKNGLGWLFRVVTEPRRLLKRYAEIVPLFIFFNIKELFSSLKKTKTVQS